MPPRLRAVLLALYRRHQEARMAGHHPLSLEEVRAFVPAAASLEPDSGPRQGWTLRDTDGAGIGYAARTAPFTDRIRGYSGPADTLVVFGADGRVAGVALRSSYDTPSHVEDVQRDVYFLSSWDGKTWEELAALDPRNAGVEGVSGATRTSLCLAQGLVHRTRMPDRPAPPPWQVTRADVFLLVALAGGSALAFAPHRPGTARTRRIFQLAVFLGVGLLGGDLLAQSLLVGWAQHGLDIRTTPGLALMAGAAFLLPWATRRPVYCAHICPHGALQEWLSRRVPARWKWQPPPDVAWGLARIPPALLLAVLLTGMLGLSLDLAGIEPFDAYAFRSAGVATLVLAGVGLLASLFVPMAYCRFGCPTGALLKFIRSHGSADHFSSRDAWAGALALLAWVLLRHADTVRRAIEESPWW